LISVLSCNNAQNANTAGSGSENKSEIANPTTDNSASRHFRGAFTNGMKGDSIFFDISADGKKLENLTFKGYWRCSGKLEQTTVGPDGSFTITGGKVNDHITEPPNGGSTAWRFELDAAINGKTASGNFRMNINNLGCDTYKLKWTAVAK
jgi:hypothetical protein